MSTEPFIAKFNDTLVFTPEDLEPIDRINIGDTRKEQGKYNKRGLSTEDIVKSKLKRLYHNIAKPKRRYFSMDLYDPVLQVRFEIKYESFHRTSSADVKFIRDVLLNPGESMYIYINLGCSDMPTIRYYHDNIYIVNGRRLTWDMLYNLHESALERLNQSNDNGYALLRWWREEETRQKIDYAVKEYIRVHGDELTRKAQKEAKAFNTMLQQLRSSIANEHFVQPIDMDAIFSTIPEEDDTDIQTIEWNEKDILEAGDCIQESVATTESYEKAIETPQSNALSYDDILSAMLKDVDRRTDIETERDVVNYLTEVPYIQKLLCTIGCLPTYFFNRFVEICTHKGIRVTHTQKNIYSLFPADLLDKQRRQYKLDGSRKMRTNIRTLAYKAAVRSAITSNPKRKRFDINDNDTDVSIFINSAEYIESIEHTQRSDDHDLSIVEPFSENAFVHIDRPTGKVITAMKEESTYPLMLRLAKSFAAYVNENGTTGREGSYFQVTLDDGNTVEYNMLRVIESVRETNAGLYHRMNTEWFNERLYDNDLRKTNRRVMLWTELCIERRLNFTQFNAILGANGPCDLHTILAVLVNNQRKNSKNNPEYAKNRTPEERAELNAFVQSKLHDIERHQLDIKENGHGGFTSCISAVKR